MTRSVLSDAVADHRRAQRHLRHGPVRHHRDVATTGIARPRRTAVLLLITGVLTVVVTAFLAYSPPTACAYGASPATPGSYRLTDEDAAPGWSWNPLGRTCTFAIADSQGNREVTVNLGSRGATVALLGGVGLLAVAGGTALSASAASVRTRSSS